MQVEEIQNTEIRACEICNGSMEYLYTIERFSNPFSIVCCKTCGLQRQEPIPDNSKDLYDQSYYEGSAEYSYHDERKSYFYDRYVWKARLKQIQKFIEPPAMLLDAGCAFGGFLREAEMSGFKSAGIEPSDFASEAARRQGINIIAPTLDQIDSNVVADASVDVLTMIEVIEHLDNPQACFEQIQRIVKPNGLLVIQTANFLGLQAKQAGSSYHYYLPGHLYYYSTANLRLLLKTYGFSRIIIYRPVDFGLLPKLLKSRGSFKKATDYFRWLRIIFYHLKGKISFRDFSLTSSMVIYAFRNDYSENKS